MHSLLFYLFSFLAVAGGILLVAFRNPVSSALSMVLSFLGLAGLFIGLNAYFVGIVQILVYAGAIMVLFLFVIMLLHIFLRGRFLQLRAGTVLDDVRVDGLPAESVIVAMLLHVFFGSGNWNVKWRCIANSEKKQIE